MLKMTAVTVAVPLELLREVAAMTRCDQHGGWCGEHESKPWPCPMARLAEYLPSSSARPDGVATMEEQATATTRCPTCLAPPGVECDRTHGLRWHAHAARVFAMEAKQNAR